MTGSPRTGGRADRSCRVGLGEARDSSSKRELPATNCSAAPPRRGRRGCCPAPRTRRPSGRPPSEAVATQVACGADPAASTSLTLTMIAKPVAGQDPLQSPGGRRPPHRPEAVRAVPDPPPLRRTALIPACAHGTTPRRRGISTRRRRAEIARRRIAGDDREGQTQPSERIRGSARAPGDVDGQAGDDDAQRRNRTGPAISGTSAVRIDRRPACRSRAS